MITTDVVIVGGGIAGLWTLNKLRQLGYSAILVETKSLGGGQTIKCQGIIHGGLKYALKGFTNSAVSTLEEMPDLWRLCLDGKGEIDLSNVEILSRGQYIWSNNTMSGNLCTLLASRILQGKVKLIPRSMWPEIMLDSAIQSNLYKLEEIVLSVPSLIKCLVQRYLSNCVKIDSENACSVEMDVGRNIKYFSTIAQNAFFKIKAQRYIFTAGDGNELFLRQIDTKPTMIRKPLHMVLLKSPNLKSLYGHYVGLSDTPYVTITTHYAKDQTPIWYLGGKLAEDGINFTKKQQIEIAKKKIANLFPNIDLTHARWETLYTMRAEAKHSDPSHRWSNMTFTNNNYIIAWPVKLALAPKLAGEIVSILQQENVRPSQAVSVDTPYFKNPEIALPIWDELSWDYN